MAAPRNNTYAVASGAGVYAGRAAPSGLPSWVTSAVAGRWGVVPVAAALSTLNPKLNASINPDYPASPEWYGSGFATIVTAWCGACYDQAGDALHLPLSGGHADYGGNEPYKLLLNQEVPTWTRLRPPSGAIGNLLTTNDGQEASGVYSDGQPRSIHSYNKPCFVPGVGPYIVAQGGTWISGQSGTKKAIAIDPVTGLGTMLAECTGSVPSPISASCFDPSRGAQGSIWGRGAGGSFAKMHRYDVAANSWTVDIGDSLAPDSQPGMCYMPDDDCILLIYPSGTRVYDCTTGTYHNPTFSGSPAASHNAGQPIWIGGKAYLWNNATSTTLVTRYTPGADPRTDTWTVDTLSVDAGNAVTPAAKQTNGTYGRFAYSPNLGIFIVMNNIDGDIHFFKPSAL